MEIKMAEKRKRSGRRITAFDIMVILLVLCLIGTVVYRVYTEIDNDKAGITSKYSIEFECEDYDSLAKYLLDEEEVYLASNGRLLGEIYKGWNDAQAIYVEYSDTEGTEQTESGNDEQSAKNETAVSYRMAKMTGKMRLNLEVLASKEGNYYSLGEVNFSKGSVIDVYTDDAEFTITITSITATK
ncbi:MAG: hypothetical protein E7592_00790 [Ruminococcaceae bacterium]|nr:hypothetical protein [Oscillospiraceae bacterium]